MMETKGLKFYKKLDIANAVMIAGWPGMGSVALGVVNYLRRKLKTVKFAEIEMEKFAALDSVMIENGIAKFPQPPRNTFYYDKEANLVIFEGELQLQGPAGIELLNKVLEIASDLKTKRIFTGAAFPLPVGHKEPPEIYGAVNKDSLRDMLVKSGVKLMEGGHISGLNGLMLGFAKEMGIEAICLLATMPQYAISLPNPKASSGIIEVLAKLLHFEVDLHEMDEYIKDMDEKMAVIEEKVKDVFTIENEEPESPPAEKKIPGYKYRIADERAVSPHSS